VGTGGSVAVTSAHPATAAHNKIEVAFRPGGNHDLMSNVEYLPVRTSDGSLVLRVVVLTPLQRLRRFLKKL